MNERIQEFARQAGAQHRLNLGVEEFCFEHHELQKFAELIVLKCANIVWDEAEKTMNPDVNDAGYKITEYFFGVEDDIHGSKNERETLQGP